MTIQNVGKEVTLPLADVITGFSNYEIKTPNGFKKVADEQAISYCGPMLALKTESGKTLTVTPSHISVVVADDGTHEARVSSALKEGDKIYTEAETLEKIVSVVERKYSGIVYDITLDAKMPVFDRQIFDVAGKDEGVSLVLFEDGHSEYMTKDQLSGISRK